MLSGSINYIDFPNTAVAKCGAKRTCYRKRIDLDIVSCQGSPKSVSENLLIRLCAANSENKFACKRA